MVCSILVLFVELRVELDREGCVPVDEVLPWLDGGDDEAIGSTSWLEVVEDVTRVEIEEPDGGWLLEDRVEVVDECRLEDGVDCVWLVELVELTELEGR